MFFILSKTVSYLTQPLVIVGILLILGIVWKKDPWKQWFLYAAQGLFSSSQRIPVQRADETLGDPTHTLGRWKRKNWASCSMG